MSLETGPTVRHNALADGETGLDAASRGSATMAGDTAAQGSHSGLEAPAGSLELPGGHRSGLPWDTQLEEDLSSGHSLFDEGDPAPGA